MALVEIRSALEKQIKTYCTTKGTLTPVWENTSVVPSKLPTVDYVKVVIGDIGVADPSLGVVHQRYRGIMRVTVYMKDSTAGLNTGITPIMTVAEEIRDLFYRGLQLTKSGVVVQIPNTPEIRSPGYSEGYIYLAVEIPFRSDIIKN
jgi:hypothetical protein